MAASLLGHADLVEEPTQPVSEVAAAEPVAITSGEQRPHPIRYFQDRAHLVAVAFALSHCPFPHRHEPVFGTLALPSPATGLKLSLFGFNEDEVRFFQFSDEDAEQRSNDLQKKLVELRPQFVDLVAQREALRASGADDTTVTDPLYDAWEPGLFRVVHRGAWHELCPFFREPRPG